MTVQEEIVQLEVRLKKTADENVQAEILMELLKLYASVNNTTTQTYIDHLLQLAEKLNEPLYNAWGTYYHSLVNRLKGEYDVSFELAYKGLSLFQQIRSTDGIAISHNNIGAVFQMQGKYPEALKNYFTSLKYREEAGDKAGIAAAYNNIGGICYNQSNYSEALKNHFAALKLREELGDKSGIAMSYHNIGNVYFIQGNYPEALKNNIAALKIRKETGDKVGFASTHSNIGGIYYIMGNYAEALKNYQATLAVIEAAGDKRGMANAYHNIGGAYHGQKNYSKALKNYRASGKLSEEIGDSRGIADSYNSIGSIYQEEGDYSKALENYFTALELQTKIGNKFAIARSYKNIGSVYVKLGDYKEAIKNQLSAMQISKEIDSKVSISDSALSLFNTYKATGDFETALKYHEMYHQLESEIVGEQSQKQLTNLNFQHNMEQKEKDLEIEQLRNVELKKEKDRSENLLLNILPAEVAEELKEKGTAAAKHFDNVTVLFTDFKGFTTVSERLTPQQLVDELHACFKAFDEIMTKYNIEKIKTVGDAYLAVSGLPLADEKHAENILKAAIEIRDFMFGRRKELGEKTFEVRIGIHSGSVVAGIVGVKKFAYDIWGDTVNTAARMEQNSEAGKINISQTTYELVKNKFRTEFRGEIEAKNKGKLKMYFVN